MVFLPLIETDRPSPAGCTDRLSKLHIAAFSPFAAEATDAQTARSWAPTSYPWQDEAVPTKKDGERLHSRLSEDPSIASPMYSLTYGPLTCPRSRSRRSPPSTTSSISSRNQTSPSLSSGTNSSFSTPASLQMFNEATIHPSDHMKSLLSLLASSISTSNMAFSLMRASSVALPSAEDSFGRAEKAMSAELQTLSDLHTKLYSLIHQHDLGMKQEYSSDTSSDDSIEAHIEKKETMLKSYEGIITRFHDEIRQKDAKTEALKQTLARSMLKGEKLTARIKALQAKQSALQ